MEIREVSTKEAKIFISKWHYSKKISGGKNVFFGWFINETLYAVANYGIGINNTQPTILKNDTGHKDITNDNLYELKRLCRIEPKNESYPLTKFLSKCHKLLKKRGIKYIISFSDPLYKHNGGIYKASNFRYLGRSRNSLGYVDKKGDLVHIKYISRLSKKHNITKEEVIKSLKLMAGKVPGKDKWFIKLW